MIELAIVETKKTLVENIVGWLKHDSDDGQYKYLQTITLMLILKYIRLVICISASNIYKLTIIVMISAIIMFKIKDIEITGKKYELVCHLYQKLLLLKDLIPYMCIDNKKNGKVINIEILERKAKSPLVLSLPQLYSGVYTTKSLCITLIEPS